MPFSTVTFYGPKGQTTAVIPPAGDLSDCDYSDSEDEEYLPVSNNTSRRATDSYSDDDDENNQCQSVQRKRSFWLSVHKMMFDMMPLLIGLFIAKKADAKIAKVDLQGCSAVNAKWSSVSLKKETVSLIFTPSIAAQQ